MSITSLYKNYFQKSRVFLYPALDIKRGGSVTPIETYMSWDGYYKLEDAKLSCLYHRRDDQEFKTFETLKLLGNKRFHDFKQVEEHKGVYVFDFSDIVSEWKHVISGKYSKLSPEYKKMIKSYIGSKSSDAVYIDSYLYPEKYFKLYADLLNETEATLKGVGELTSLPCMESETLKMSVLDLKIEKNNVF